MLGLRPLLQVVKEFNADTLSLTIRQYIGVPDEGHILNWLETHYPYNLATFVPTKESHIPHLMVEFFPEHVRLMVTVGGNKAFVGTGCPVYDFIDSICVFGKKLSEHLRSEFEWTTTMIMFAIEKFQLQRLASQYS